MPGPGSRFCRRTSHAAGRSMGVSTLPGIRIEQGGSSLPAICSPALRWGSWARGGEQGLLGEKMGLEKGWEHCWVGATSQPGQSLSPVAGKAPRARSWHFQTDPIGHRLCPELGAGMAAPPETLWLSCAAGSEAGAADQAPGPTLSRAAGRLHQLSLTGCFLKH